MDREKLFDAMGWLDDDVLDDDRYVIRSLLLSVLMALLTVFFCLYVADGLFGIRGYKITKVIGEDFFGPVIEKSVDPTNQTGAVLFWIFIIGLPLVFSRWVKWRFTFMNMVLYGGLWWVVDAVVGMHPGHYFLAIPSSFLYYIDKFVKPWYTLVCFWLIQSAVFAAVNLFRWYRRRRKLRKSINDV